MDGTTIIECVVFFYEKAKSKFEYIRKEKFCACVAKDISSLKVLKNTIW